MTERIVRIIPSPSMIELDIIIEEQAQYYGQRNQHVIAYLEHLFNERKVK